MWEIEIVADRQSKDKIHSLLNSVSKVLHCVKAVSSILGDERRIYFCIGVGDKGEAKLKSSLSLAICDLFCLDYKYDFLKEHLKLDHSDEKSQVLEKLCTFFDRETERVMVLTLLDPLPQTLDLDSFYYFRLRGLKQKWGEFCDLIKDNLATITTQNNFAEFVQFLLVGINCRSKSLILDLREGGIIYKDSSGQDTIEIINPKDLTQILVKLVELNPQEILIRGGGRHKERVAFLKEVFLDKIKLR